MTKLPTASGCVRVILPSGLAFLVGAFFGAQYACPPMDYPRPDIGDKLWDVEEKGNTHGDQIFKHLAITRPDSTGTKVGKSNPETPPHVESNQEEAPTYIWKNRRASPDRSLNGAKSPGTSKKLRVAFAVFVTDISNAPWEDALAILAYSLKKALKKSRHQAEMLILAPERLETSKANLLLEWGFEKIIKKPVPVEASEVKKPFAREHMERVQGTFGPFKFLMAEETVKYWGIAFTEYDRVLVLDADVMILDPMDELMEMAADFVGVYDHGLDTPGSTSPPTQGGFLLFRPSLEDFEAVKELTREGDWSGSGWKRSGIGYCYGGVGPDGLLPYYYNKDALSSIKARGKANLPEGTTPEKLEGSRWLAVDREVYDVVVNQRLRDELGGRSHEQALARVKSVHFTGDCVKPWSCSEPHVRGDWFCRGLMDKWWAMRAELESARGLQPSQRSCTHGQYVPLGKGDTRYLLMAKRGKGGSEGQQSSKGSSPERRE